MTEIKYENCNYGCPYDTGGTHYPITSPGFLYREDYSYWISYAPSMNTEKKIMKKIVKTEKFYDKKGRITKEITTEETIEEVNDDPIITVSASTDDIQLLNENK